MYVSVCEYGMCVKIVCVCVWHIGLYGACECVCGRRGVSTYVFM